MLRQPAARSSSSIVDVVVAVLEEDDGDDLDIANDAAGVATAVPFAAVVLDYVLVVVVAVLFFFSPEMHHQKRWASLQVCLFVVFTPVFCICLQC